MTAAADVGQRRRSVGVDFGVVARLLAVVAMMGVLLTLGQVGRSSNSSNSSNSSSSSSGAQAADAGAAAAAAAMASAASPPKKKWMRHYYGMQGTSRVCYWVFTGFPPADGDSIEPAARRLIGRP